MDEDLKQKLYWAAVIILGLIAIFTLGSNFLNTRNEANQVATEERVTGDYQLAGATGPENFSISVKETSTGKMFNNVFVSAACPLYSTKALPGTKATLIRFTNVNLITGEKTYRFLGAYEQFCTNEKYNAKSGQGYLSN